MTISSRLMHLGETETDECLVIMPFGVKPMRDGSGRTYDFDKVYRVSIKRAVEQAGLRPVRADERVGSSIIHSDMFKDLRDRSVVVADLSLENPNVFYELGIRHVMSTHGTVLICRKGTDLPFDVQLSRVVFYEYDGKSFDWEEAERLVESLQIALQVAKTRQPDSPVHALLERVFKSEILGWSTSREDIGSGEAKSLEKYQELIADFWIEQAVPLEKLFSNNYDTVFGARALGYYCLKQDVLPEITDRVAAHLSSVEQYPLANRLFEKLGVAGRLSPRDRLRYAGSYTEEHPTLDGADMAISWVKELLAQLQSEQEGLDAAHRGERLTNIAHAQRRLAGLLEWRSQITKQKKDVQEAIDTFQAAIEAMGQLRAPGQVGLGYIAQDHLKRMLLLRIRDDNANRPDTEGDRDAILVLKGTIHDDPCGLSYLRWYQAIALADAGEEAESQRCALRAFAEDAKIMNDPTHWEIGRRQYRNLRRFLEQYSGLLRHPSLLGGIAQVLQIGHRA